jgi:hypothetical protein
MLSIQVISSRGKISVQKSGKRPTTGEKKRRASQAVDRLSTLQENAPGAGHRLAQLGGVGGGSSVLPCVEGRA